MARDGPAFLSYGSGDGHRWTKGWSSPGGVRKKESRAACWEFRLAHHFGMTRSAAPVRVGYTGHFSVRHALQREELCWISSNKSSANDC